MGKRKKSSRGPTKRVKQVLPTTFTCLFCSHDDSVVCTIDKKNDKGYLSCKVCGQKFQTKTHRMSAPIDVYSDWVDACEAVAANPPAAAAEVEDYSDHEDY